VHYNENAHAQPQQIWKRRGKGSVVSELHRLDEYGGSIPLFDD
jgi:hypothetical protein